MVWGIAAAVGVSALLAASELACRVLTMAGAAYMVWLGASQLWKSRGKATPPAGPRDVTGSPLLMGILLAGVHCVLGLVWSTFLIFGVGLASKWLKGARSVRIIDRITGTVLVGFGLKLALEPRH